VIQEFQPKDVGDWAIALFKCNQCLAQNNRKISLDKADQLALGTATILNSKDEHVRNPEKVIDGSDESESPSPRNKHKHFKNKKSWTTMFRHDLVVEDELGHQYQ
jgi:hypothetical protein